ncbi:MAG: Trk family potassium uptake protein [Lachnospiraceae bacterium]|nr:Trk family potassium uptake protein [Lachnospiraceae bacterium]
MISPIKNKRSRSAFRIIILSFFILIMVGSILLMLPISSRSRVMTSFPDALFTAVSATCVTGLVVKDTATYWSTFGQIVILTMIQIGGMGVITVGLAILRASGRKIGLMQRTVMQESVAAHNISGMVKLTAFIIKGTLLIEGIGAAMLLPVFLKEYRPIKAIGYSVFHSISAFCNAGFDLMGEKGEFSSLTSYSANAYLNIVIMLLIIIGGIGFLTWSDVIVHKFNIKKYALQSKIVLLTSIVLIVFPAIYFIFGEYGNLPIKERLASSFFQSVTARTAGFNTQDLSAMSESGTAVMLFLMMIGGSSGSTAGGMKTTTLAVLFLAAISVFARKKEVPVFKRRIAEDTIRTAGAILFMYFALSFTVGIIISKIEGLPLLVSFFEADSAIATVGLTMGITTSLSLISRILLMFLMFFGRVGGLTLIYAAVSSEDSNAMYPLEKITVG